MSNKIDGYGIQQTSAPVAGRAAAVSRSGGDDGGNVRAVPVVDSVALTADAQNLQKLEKAMSSVPVVDNDRVEKIRVSRHPARGVGHRHALQGAAARKPGGGNRVAAAGHEIAKLILHLHHGLLCKRNTRGRGGGWLRGDAQLGRRARHLAQETPGGGAVDINQHRGADMGDVPAGERRAR